MKKELPLKDFVYTDDKYTFAFVKPNEAFQSSLIVRPKHIKVLSNDTEMSTKELKEFIVKDWFEEENEQIKLAQKRKRELKKAV